MTLRKQLDLFAKKKEKENRSLNLQTQNGHNKLKVIEKIKEQKAKNKELIEKIQKLKELKK